jgi:hypothetical protein
VNSHAKESSARSAISWGVWVPDIFLPFVKGSKGFEPLREVYSHSFSFV